MRRKREVWAKRERGEQLTEEERAVLTMDPSEARKSKALDRWRQVKTLIIDESACLVLAW